LKIILNGGVVESVAHKLCYAVEETPADAIDYDYGIKIVEQLNKAEDAMFAAQRLFLESQDFHGPWPKSLS